MSDAAPLLWFVDKKTGSLSQAITKGPRERPLSARLPVFHTDETQRKSDQKLRLCVSSAPRRHRLPSLRAACPLKEK